MEAVCVLDVLRQQLNEDEVADIETVVWSAVASVTGVIATCGKRIRLWRQRDGVVECFWVSPLEVKRNGQLSRVHSKSLRRCAWSSDGCLLAVGSFDGTTSLWHYDGTTASFAGIVAGHENEVKAVEFQDQRLLASCSRDRSIWINEIEGDVGECEASVVSLLHGHSQDVKICRWRPPSLFDDGLVLASGSYDNSVRLWCKSHNADDFTLAQVLDDQGSTVWGVAFHPRGMDLCAVTHSGTLRVYRDASQVKRLELFRNQRRANEASTGARILANMHGLDLWSRQRPAETGLDLSDSRLVGVPDVLFRCLQTLQLPVVPAFDCDWTSVYLDATQEFLDVIAVAGAGGNVVVVSRTSGNWMSESGSVFSVLSVIKAHEQDVNSVRWTPDNQLLTCSDDGTAKLWTLQSSCPT
ncbi:MAG: uncharacterized protein KVP18_002858 [Porospora cf. gigantea A]|uniref:uncharacterized protein n=1 Tax=Porospora cf. gigantea A TaxID=2853593 RepID=UPI00355A015C|nr:MAG: hypothetical protein KVP18_002858 [Porospora cf. gigantea A]